MTTLVRPGWPYLDKRDPWSSHSRIDAWLATLPIGTRVLDVGAASGTLGRLCVGRGFVLHGIEPNPAWAAAAEPFYTRLSCATLDSSADQELAGFDVVVLADVIEHIAEPADALRRLVALQRPGATFIISVPNVANIWVRLNLLLGHFDYSERGILDRTHLRFFTRRTLTRLLHDCELRPQATKVTPIPLNLVHPWFAEQVWGQRIHSGLAQLSILWPTLLGYQFVVRATVERKP